MTQEQENELAVWEMRSALRLAIAKTQAQAYKNWLVRQTLLAEQSNAS